jgi:hypothetical protein
MSQQIVVDLLATLELDVRLALGTEYAGMRSIPTAVRGDVIDVAHPPIQAEQMNGVAPTK